MHVRKKKSSLFRSGKPLDRAFSRQIGKEYLQLLHTYLRPQWRSVLLMSLLLLISIGLQLVNPQLLQAFIDAALQGAAKNTLVMLGLLFVVIALGTQGLSTLAIYLSENVAWTATNRLREDLVAHCLALDMAFHKDHTPGELIQRVDSDVDALASFFSQAIIQLVGNLLLMFGIVLVLFYRDWRLGLMMLVFIILAFVFLTFVNKYGMPRWLAFYAKNAEFFGQLGEHLEGTEEIRGNGATSFVMRRFYLFLRPWLSVSQRGIVAVALWFAGTMTIFSLGNMMALVVGAGLLGAHVISYGTVYMTFYYTNLVMVPIEQIRNQIQELQGAGVGIQRIQRLLKTRSLLLHDHDFQPVGADTFPAPGSHTTMRCSQQERLRSRSSVLPSATTKMSQFCVI